MGKSLDIIKAPKQKPVTPENVGDRERERDKNSFFDTPDHEEKSDPLLFYLILGLCAIVLLVALSVWLIYKSFNSDNTSKSASQTSSSTSSSSGAAADKKSVTTSSSSTTSETSEFNKADVKIRIVNGNGRTGEANLMKTALEDDGFKNITTGNATSRYSTTVVYYNTGKLAQAKAVEKIISSKYQTSLLEDPNITKDNDVVVALGAK